MTDATATTPRRTHIAVRVLEIAAALFFALSAVPKLMGQDEVRETFDKIGFGDGFMYLIGGLELAGAVALLIPALAGLAASAFLALMAGATITHIVVLDGEGVLVPVIAAVPVACIAWARRERTAELLRRVAGRAA
ncbi:DoxX family protein [Streptomyces sp. NPDC048639]|uniref:DoxX family protein n=1 Tax=Streptomyces sp. NPDC048639 TaxID=3365581 RepID=UPI003712EC32